MQEGNSTNKSKNDGHIIFRNTSVLQVNQNLQTINMIRKIYREFETSLQIFLKTNFQLLVSVDY